MNTELIFLYQRYQFNKDMGDVARANYWMARINEYKKLHNIQ
jgi:hypothetical protein